MLIKSSFIYKLKNILTVNNDKMFSGKDAANAAYPTQWALNPVAYQNIDSSQVDWAALAQQWIAMKEAVAIVGGPQVKPDVEEGEAPMEVENPDTNNDAPVTPDAEWNASTNSWGGSWNQWGWGWPGSGPVDPKIAADPTMAIPPMMDGYPVTEGSASMPGYTTGTVAGPTYQHGYWTASQEESTSENRSGSHSREHRSKSKNKDSSKSNRNKSQRDKSAIMPSLIEPIEMPTTLTSSTIDAAKRRQLPAWIREGLEKMEREKQKAIEREQEKKAREQAELEKKRLEEEELQRIKAEAGGGPVLPVKSKFDTDSDGSLSDAGEAEAEKKDPDAGDRSPLVKKTREEILQEVMIAVRRSLTEILLEVTDHEIQTVSQEELARYNSVQASRINALKASRSKALASIATGLGLGAYESSDESADEEPNDITDQQLQDIIRRKKMEFERTSREIEAEVRRAELKESGEGTLTPTNTTPERPRRSRSSATPPPVERETPEKKPERRPSKDKRNNHKNSDKVDGRKLDSIQEEKPKKSSKHERTPSPQKSTKASKGSTNSSSSDSEDDSSSSGSKSSSESEPEVIEVENSRPKKRKRKNSSSSGSQKKSKKHKKDKSHKPSDKHYSRSKHYDDYEKTEKSKKRRDVYEKHKSRSRDAYKDKYRDDSDDERTRKRSKRSRSISYESRSGRRKSRDRSEDRSRRRKRSYDRDRSYDRGHEYKYDRYERARDGYSRHRR